MNGANSAAAAANEARDARTHGSWETKNDLRPWSGRGKTWLLMPAVAMVLGSAAGYLYWRGQGLPWLTRTPATVAASQGPAALPTTASAGLAPPGPATSVDIAVTSATATATASASVAVSVELGDGPSTPDPAVSAAKSALRLPGEKFP